MLQFKELHENRGELRAIFQDFSRIYPGEEISLSEDEISARIDNLKSVINELPPGYFDDQVAEYKSGISKIRQMQTPKI